MVATPNVHNWSTESKIFDCDSAPALAEYTATPLRLRNNLKFEKLTPAPLLVRFVMKNIKLSAPRLLRNTLRLRPYSTTGLC